MGESTFSFDGEPNVHIGRIRVYSGQDVVADEWLAFENVLGGFNCDDMEIGYRSGDYWITRITWEIPDFLPGEKDMPMSHGPVWVPHGTDCTLHFSRPAVVITA